MLFNDKRVDEDIEQFAREPESITVSYAAGSEAFTSHKRRVVDDMGFCDRS